MPIRTRRLALDLEGDVALMLKELARATGKTQANVVEALIRGAYQKLLPRLRVRAGFGFDPAVVTRKRKLAQKKPAARGRPPKKR
jgi:hypothetical protein